MARYVVAIFLALSGSTALASGFQLDTLQNLNQGEFRQLSQDLGASMSYKPMEPADPLGIAGFDLGASVSATTLANTAALQKAVSNSSVYSTLPEPAVRIVKGLPFDVDVGLMYSRVPSSGINLYGAELKWAVLPGGIALPAVALRATFTRINGVSQLSFETASADISISKDFVFVTPYAGVGQVRSRSSTDGLPLQQENLGQNKVFGGVQFNLGLGNVVIEADSTGGIHSYGLKAGFRF